MASGRTFTYGACVDRDSSVQCIIHGRVYWDGAAYVRTTNDTECTLTSGVASLVELGFATAFSVLPTVTASYLKATNEAGVTRTVSIEEVTISLVKFRLHSIDDTGAGVTDVTNPTAATNDGFEYIIIGERAR